MKELESLIHGISWESLSHISLGAALLLIFALGMVFVLLRALLRFASNSLLLAAAVFAGFSTWRAAPDLVATWVPHPPEWLTYLPPALAFAATWTILRRVLRMLVAPADAEAPRPPIARGISFAATLVPVALIWMAAAALIRHADSVSSLRQFVESKTSPAKTPGAAGGKLSKDKDSWWSPAADWLARSVPASWWSVIDPAAGPERATLAKLLTVERAALPPRAIPVLEDPAVRAAALHQAQMRALAKDRRYDAVLRHPDLDKALQNPELRRALENLHL